MLFQLKTLKDIFSVWQS